MLKFKSIGASIRATVRRCPVPFKKGVLVLLACVLFVGCWYAYKIHAQTLPPYPELTQIQQHESSFNDLSSYFKQIAQQKGALYAYEILRRAQLPPQTDVHLLGHVIGNELYKQYGEDAISYCTDEFRNACSHTVVVGLLLDYGEKALTTISAACQKAPGGVGAYTMCFHGLGHGVLSYENYDLQKTIALCKKTGTAGQHYQEYPQCVGGAIMELISGGDHSPDVWSAARPHYLNTTDPLSPCDQPYMPKEAAPFCYVYITPHLVEAAGGVMAHPDPSVFPKAFSFCDALGKDDPNRTKCIQSFGKEFIWWARDSDARDIDTLTDTEIGRMTSWCALSGNRADTTLCLKGIQDSIYWGGENDPKASVRFCTFLGKQDADAENTCFTYLTVLIGRYVPDQTQHAEICSLLPAEDSQACLLKQQ